MQSRIKAIRERSKVDINDILDALKISEDVYFKLEQMEEKDIPVRYLINLSLFYKRPVSDFITDKKLKKQVNQSLR